MADEPTTKIKWCGPEGHHSPLLGPLVPGQVYEVPTDAAPAFLRTPDCWQLAKKTKQTEDE